LWDLRTGATVCREPNPRALSLFRVAVAILRRSADRLTAIPQDLAGTGVAAAILRILGTQYAATPQDL
jgi:hypothetical protein